MAVETPEYVSLSCQNRSHSPSQNPRRSPHQNLRPSPRRNPRPNLPMIPRLRPSLRRNLRPNLPKSPRRSLNQAESPKTNVIPTWKSSWSDQTQTRNQSRSPNLRRRPYHHLRQHRAQCRDRPRCQGSQDPSLPPGSPPPEQREQREEWPGARASNEPWPCSWYYRSSGSFVEEQTRQMLFIGRRRGVEEDGMI
ncbi:unnamed protein product [Musa acuminata subsp. malaccensis]|uniref:(wild Malaysian banana) hypothetical protein n=1 Tax=Musa acuminata subsp. malaccensis TaxID=214687 RepID=A0A8D7AEX7_MUSAM|nr:unnamed protein product [Musa acuminata subsp. malaccensis]